MRKTHWLTLASGFVLAGVVAGLLARPVSAQGGGFNGVWTVSVSSPSCFNKISSYRLRVGNGKVSGRLGSGGGISGSVSSGGSIRWTTKAAYDGAAVHWTGRLSGGGGSGSFARADGKCGGTFSLRRG